MRLSDFDFDLPQELIAQKPIEPRDHSRLLVVDKKSGEINHKIFKDIIDILQPGDVLVTNNSRVIPARLFGVKKDTGAKVEIVLLSRVNGNQWEALVKPGKKLKPGAEVIIGEDKAALTAKVLSTTEVGGRLIEFSYEGIFEEILDQLGNMPLPPYIKEELQEKERYQTVYAKERGSAAAPTAGLHFTPELIENLKKKGVEWTEVMLHVGLGTFRPVQVDNVEEHKMHAEFFRVTAEAAKTINEARDQGRRIIAVGTTAIRTLESAAINNKVRPIEGWTDIFIYPGYEFKIVDALITNFHLPKSTLLMLISAFITREKTMEIYQEAIREEYRFFSFGDAMMII